MMILWMGKRLLKLLCCKKKQTSIVKEKTGGNVEYKKKGNLVGVPGKETEMFGNDPSKISIGVHRINTETNSLQN